MSTWSELSTKDRAALIQMMAKEGISSLDEMEEYYNNATQEESSDEEYSEEEPDEYFPMEASSQQGNSSLSSGDVTTGRQYYIKPDGGIGIREANTYALGGFDKQKLVNRVNKSPANWVQRLQDQYRRVINNPDGSVSTHRLGYATKDSTAIVFPEISGTQGLLYYPLDPVETAIQNRDTVEMSIPEAEWFTKNYKDYYDGFEFSSGGKIHIKPENRGKFTALKKRTGHSATWFKQHGTPAQKKMATFALNAKKWKHADGGPIDEEDSNFVGPPSPDLYPGMIQKLEYERRKLADVLSSDSTYEDKVRARKEYDDLKRQVAKQTIEKYPYITAPGYVNWSSDDDNAYLEGTGIRLDTTDAKDAVNFYTSYVNSEGYKRILEDQDEYWKNQHPKKGLFESSETKEVRKAMRKAAETPMNAFVLDGYPELSFYKPWGRTAFIMKSLVDDPTEEFPYLQAVGHEVGHHFNALGNGQEEALDINKGYKEDGHDELYSERHADALALKYLLYKHNIYDSRNPEKVTPQQIEQLRKIYPNIRTFQQMKSNEDVAKMLNLVADTGTNTPRNLAKRGGRLNLAPYALGGPINPNNYLPSFIGRRKPLPDVRY